MHSPKEIAELTVGQKSYLARLLKEAHDCAHDGNVLIKASENAVSPNTRLELIKSAHSNFKMASDASHEAMRVQSGIVEVETSLASAT